LRRYGACQTFTYQFTQIAARKSAAVVPACHFPNIPAYDYRRRFGTPVPGLAAVKHTQREDERQKRLDEFRWNARVRARHAREAEESNVASTQLKDMRGLQFNQRGPIKPDPQAAPPTQSRYQYMSIGEKCAVHLVDGTIDQFLASLSRG